MAGTHDGGLVLVRVPRRLFVAEVVKDVQGSAATYSTQWVFGDYRTIVETTIPRRCHVACASKLRVVGRVLADVESAEEDAAERLLRLMRSKHGVRVDDVNWAGANRARRRNILHRVFRKTIVSKHKAAVGKAVALERGWGNALADLRDAARFCAELHRAASGEVPLVVSPAMLGHLAYGVKCQGEWVNHRANVSSAGFEAAAAIGV
ncbi:unnamed protein product [Alopecurus aequalis]